MTANNKRAALERELKKTQEQRDQLKEARQETKNRATELENDNNALKNHVSELERSYNFSRERNAEQELELAYLQQQLEEMSDSRPTSVREEPLQPSDAREKEVESLNMQLAHMKIKDEENSNRVRQLRHDLEEKIAHNNHLNSVIDNLNARYLCVYTHTLC